VSLPTRRSSITNAYVGPYFSADGHADLDVARQAIAAVAAELGVAEIDAQTVYGEGRST
jgi:hypothetical protein